MKNVPHKIMASVCMLFSLLLHYTFASGYSVTALKATYQNGQVFLTWTSPSASNLQYNVYRSTSKITSSNQLTSSTYLGYVRDNSAKNVRKSELQRGSSYYFIIDGSGNPLKSTQGLYVATCIDNKKYYYAVTVKDLSTNKESKTISIGDNSLSNAVSEKIDNPQPMLQLTETEDDGVLHYEYVLWGNNQNASHYPAFNNCGSYGYNFSVFKRGTTKNNSLYVTIKDNNPFSEETTNLCDNCTVLKMDDWLPNESNTYWVGYNNQYDIYSTNNPVFTTGTVVTYTQKRVRETLEWARKNLNVDSEKVYLTGSSHNGFGAMFNGQLNPDMIAALYGKVPPILIKAENGTDREHQWCDNSVDLLTDIIDPRTNQPIEVWHLFDNRFMDRLHYDSGIPYMGGVNGKNDVTVGWVQKFAWYDSLSSTRAGGAWYWDQRDHGGDGAQFTPDETTPDYERFAINKSYPAFAYCSVNQNPGDGDPQDGAPYGAINGYLDWNDGSIDDEACKYAITCFVKDFYLGGKLDKKQYDSCTTDLTIRRAQQFHPAVGSKITWSVKNNSGKKVQSGTFTYYGGAITLYGLKIYRSNSNILLTANNCTEAKITNEQAEDGLRLVPISGGYELIANTKEDGTAQLKIFDEMGRLISAQQVILYGGLNSLPLYFTKTGFYFVTLEGKDLYESIKLDYVK